MKISEFIKNLQDFMEKNGDLDCRYPGDDELNYTNAVYFTPSVVYITIDGECYTEKSFKEIIEESAEFGEEPPEAERVCLVC